jgi:hypothetical protein
LAQHWDGRLCSLAQITLVGKVLSTSESGLTHGLKIDDGTGRVDVKIWINEDGAWLPASLLHGGCL